MMIDAIYSSFAEDCQWWSMLQHTMIQIYKGVILMAIDQPCALVAAANVHYDGKVVMADAQGAKTGHVYLSIKTAFNNMT